MKSIPLFKVHMPESVLKPVNEVLMSGYVSEGKQSHEFEEKFQEFIGNENISLVNNGTAAITIALRMSGIKEGDEIISTPMTCLATNEPILQTKAKIVWADIDLNTGNIDADDVEKKITEKTKAIMVVHWAGIPVDLDKIHSLAKEHNLIVIEDAAHAINTYYKGKKIGAKDICSDFVCYSFQAIKHLTTVDGGALAMKTEDNKDRATLLRWYGCSRNSTSHPIVWKGDVKEPGYKMHMNNLNATIGLEQLKYVDNLVEKHKRNAKYLINRLKEIPEIETMKPLENTDPSWWIFTILLPEDNFRAKFSEKLTSINIQNGIVHKRNDEYELFKEFKTELPNLDIYSRRMLNIPCGWWLEEEDLDYMIEKFKEVIKEIKLENQ